MMFCAFVNCLQRTEYSTVKSRENWKAIYCDICWLKKLEDDHMNASFKLLLWINFKLVIAISEFRLFC